MDAVLLLLPDALMLERREIRLVGDREDESASEADADGEEDGDDYESWRRSSGTPASCTRGSVLQAQIAPLLNRPVGRPPALRATLLRDDGNPQGKLADR